MHSFYLLILPLPLGKSLIFHVSLVIFSISPCPKLLWPYCLVPPHHRSCQRPGCFPSPGWIPPQIAWNEVDFQHFAMSASLRKCENQPSQRVMFSPPVAKLPVLNLPMPLLSRVLALDPTKTVNITGWQMLIPYHLHEGWLVPLVGIPADRCRGCWT